VSAVPELFEPQRESGIVKMNDTISPPELLVEKISAYFETFLRIVDLIIARGTAAAESRIDVRRSRFVISDLPTQPESKLNLAPAIGGAERVQDPRCSADTVRRARMVKHIERVHIKAQVELLGD